MWQTDGQISQRWRIVAGEMYSTICIEWAVDHWHNSLNIEQSYRIESIQKRAVKIIYGPGDYHDIFVWNKVYQP